MCPSILIEFFDITIRHCESVGMRTEREHLLQMSNSLAVQSISKASDRLDINLFPFGEWLKTNSRLIQGEKNIYTQTTNYYVVTDQIVII